MDVAPFCAENSILYIYPYLNPQCWMNSRAVMQADAIIDCAIERFGVDKNIPVGIYGGSMGGYSTFHFVTKTKHNVVAADVNCPCCNMEFEMYCNQLPIRQTYFESSLDDTDDFEKYIAENSPVNMVDKLPKIPYRFAVGLKDNILVPSQHSILMTDRMIAAGHDVERVDYPAMAHCNLTYQEKLTEFTWLCNKILSK